MTPHLAAELTIEDGGIAELEGAFAAFPSRSAARVGHVRPRPAPLQRRSLARRVLLAADVATSAAALALVLTTAQDAAVGAALLIGVVVLVGLLKLGGLYDRDDFRLVHSTLDETPALAQMTGLVTVGLAILQPVLLADPLTGAQLGLVWAACFSALAGGRAAARSATRRLLPSERCLLVGGSDAAEQLRAKLASSEAHATLVARLPLDDSGLPPMLNADDVREIVGELGIDRVVIAPTASDDGFAIELIRAAKHAGVPVSVLPRMLEVVGSGAVVEEVDGVPMLAVRPFALPRSAHMVKRAFDLVATSLGLVVVVPVLAAAALAIRLDSPGPVFFRQRRVGRDGCEFDIIKFRSMVADADGRKDELRGLNEVGEGMFKVSGDPRVTTVGRFLRRTSLDELPQLFNVLRGDMSLVGPRPLVVEEDALITGLDRGRLHLTPGMTGSWQVLGARVPMHEMLGIDYLYVSTWSLWGDVKILIRTVRHVVRSGNV